MIIAYKNIVKSTFSKSDRYWLRNSNAQDEDNDDNDDDDDDDDVDDEDTNNNNNNNNGNRMLNLLLFKIVQTKLLVITFSNDNR